MISTVPNQWRNNRERDGNIYYIYISYNIIETPRDR